MKTTSVMIQSLCVPCYNHCRHCLLSWNDRVEGALWERSVLTAERFINEIQARRPKLEISFSFGYSMEHPDLKGAIRTLRRLGSPTASFLQCDGMQMRDAESCTILMQMLKAEGIEELNSTVYGLAEYHDRFAGRQGDYALLIRMMQAAAQAGIPFSIGIPVTKENIMQVDPLVDTLKALGSERIRLFIPHEEGRGKTLAGIRLCTDDLLHISADSRALLNDRIFRTEADWVSQKEPVQETRRSILISLREDNIADYEKRTALAVLEEIEDLDERYYAAFPLFGELAVMYGDPNGKQLYQYRDLYHHYRRLYAEEHDVHVYDVTDERQSGSRRA